MPFHVRMNVTLPASMPAEEAARLEQTEKEFSQRLQRLSTILEGDMQ